MMSRLPSPTEFSFRPPMREADAWLPTAVGEFQMVVYERDHVALVLGDPAASAVPVLVRIHSECLTGDIFGSLRCDCGAQLREAMQRVAAEGCGIILYMRQEGRGIGLVNKLRAYRLQEAGKDTVEANEALGFDPDARDYGACASMLADLGVRRVRLLTNNPQKVEQLQAHGLEVHERVPLQVPPTASSLRYLRTKRDKMGHQLEV